MKELFFFMSTLCSADDVWQQSNLAPASVLFSLLAFCLAVPASLLDISELCELLQILQRPSVK